MAMKKFFCTSAEKGQANKQTQNNVHRNKRTKNKFKETHYTNNRMNKETEKAEKKTDR